MSAPTLQAGALRERVTIQAAAVTLDPYGDPALAWSDIATVWARVRATGGSAPTLADRRTAIEELEVTVRWRADVSVRDRLVWRGRFLRVEQLANPDERRIVLVLQCRDTGAP